MMAKMTIKTPQVSVFSVAGIGQVAFWRDNAPFLLCSRPFPLQPDTP